MNVIVAANDNMALGAAEAVQALNRPGILITGFDATEAGLEAVRDGRVAATLDQAPGAQARLALNLLVRHLETREAFPPFVLLSKAAVVTAETLRAARP